MADESLKPLVTLGPFKGLDYSTSDNLVEADRAIAASNANPTIVAGALLPERGRVNAADFSAYMTDVATVVTGIISQDQVVYIAQDAGANNTVLYNPATNIFTRLTGVNKFDQAVQYAAVLYTNGGQRLFLSTLGSYSQFFQWGYPAPAAAGNLTLASTTGTIPAGTYYYVITRTTTMPDGSISETSVDLNQYASPPSITLASAGGITVTPANGLTFAGTNSDGSSYTTNLYRQSTNQPTYLFVANLTSNAAYTDNAADTAIAGNAQLLVHRDVVPTTVNNSGALAVHKNRVWCFLTVDDANTNNLPQAQLWYSNVDRPWEFDDTSQVLLMQSDVTSVPQTPQNYNTLYGNEPKGITEVGTLLIAFKRRETWAVYGDDSTSFVQRQLFNIGCMSKHAITETLGGVFWLSENGPYFFDGSAPQYIGDRINGYLRPVPGVTGAPGSNGIAPSDQVQACGAFSNLTWYLCFPTIQQTLAYHTVNGEWSSVLPYAPASASALTFTAAHPSSYNGTLMNEVVAVRSGTTKIDWWFADPSLDLGAAQTFSWTGPASVTPDEGWDKIYRFLTLLCPIQQGSATVTLTVDGGSTPTKQVVWTIPDLSVAPRYIKPLGTLQGTSLRGFTASLSVSVTGAAGQPAPQIWRVACWGAPSRFLEVKV